MFRISNLRHETAPGRASVSPRKRRVDIRGRMGRAALDRVFPRRECLIDKCGAPLSRRGPALDGVEHESVGIGSPRLGDVGKAVFQLDEPGRG